MTPHRHRPKAAASTVRAARPGFYAPRLESLEARELLDSNLSSILPSLASDLSSYPTDYILVRYHPGVDANAVAQAVPGARITEAIAEQHNLYQVSLPPGVSVSQAVAIYQQSPLVHFAQPDYALSLAAIPNDPQFASMWNLNNASLQTADINAPQAWDIRTSARGIIVAVIDTGIDYTHPDLAANMWRNPGEIPGNGIDDDGNGFIDDVYGWDFANNDNNPMDDQGHGTHVAGTIGAVGNNGIGVTGVAWEVQLMAVKFLNSRGQGSTSAAIKSINYAVAHGAKILNNSWGGGGFDQLLSNTIDAARANGVIFVAAAGNNTRNNDVTPTYPANYPQDNIVAVAATDNANRLATYSNYGLTSVDIAAPGTNILSTRPGNSYGVLSGTSMATPHVSGALALVWAEHPEWNYRQVINQVLTTGAPLASLAGKTVTGRRLDLAAALGHETAPPEPPRDTKGPQATAITPVFGGPGILSGVRLTFSEAILAASFGIEDVVNITSPRGTLRATAVVPVAGTDNQFDILFPNQNTIGNYRVTVGPGITDLAGNEMDQNNNNRNGERPWDQFYGTVTLSSNSGYSSSNVPKAIQDFQRTVSTLLVPKSLTVAAVQVTVNVDHSWVGDLHLRLRAPSGKEVVLIDRRGGSGRNLAKTLFDDRAPTSIAAGTAPFTGSYRPETALSQFKGQNAKGTWQLTIDDRSGGNVGKIVGWSLNIEAQTVASTSLKWRALDDTGTSTSTPTTAGNPSERTEGLPLVQRTVNTTPNKPRALSANVLSASSVSQTERATTDAAFSVFSMSEPSRAYVPKAVENLVDSLADWHAQRWAMAGV
jgi:subtilisin family serine protease/subtilisin-like proprotein convertase family protein